METNTKKVIVDSDFDTGFALGAAAAVTFNDVVSRPTTTKAPDQSGEYIKWGDTNDFPNEVIEDLKKDTSIGTAIHKDASLLCSGKLIFGVDNGNGKISPVEDQNLVKEILGFLRRSAIKRYLIEAAVDLKMFYNVFPEIILTKDREKIASLSTIAAEKCRWAVQNQDNMIESCYVSSKWPSPDLKNKKETAIVTVIDPYHDAVAKLKQSKEKSFNYIFPVSYPTPGFDFYQLANWNTIRSSGWLKIAASIPKYKDAILKNAAFLRYHIEFSNQYWKLKFTNWDSISEKEKVKIKTSELEDIQNVIMGYEQAGKCVVTSFYTDMANGKDWPMVKITAIDQKLNDELFLKDDERASSHKLSALGIHPALLGHAPGSGSGGYGGSDIREAYNLHVISNSAMRNLILEPLNFIAEFNWPDKGIVFDMEQQFMTTLDKGKELKA